MRIAPDVEKLMWIVAESADAQAVADFESRFPDLRYELSKRIDMVRELKASRKIGESGGRIPQFSAPLKPSPISGRWRLTVAFAALSALAFGSFYVTKWVTQPAPKESASFVDPEKSVETPLAVPQIQYNPAPKLDPAPSPTTNPDANDVIVTEAPWDRLQNVRFERIHLKDALRAIGQQSGLAVEIGPGMPNPEIQADYQGQSGLQILADMGPRFGFTAFHQGEGKVILIPARDGTDDLPANESNKDGNHKLDDRPTKTVPIER